MAGTPFDFRKPTAIGERIRDARDQQIRLRPRLRPQLGDRRRRRRRLRLAARVEDPVSGRVMEMLASAPGIQFYTGNFMDGTIVGKASKRLSRRATPSSWSRSCSPTRPTAEFGSVRLDPGQRYENTMMFRFSVRAASLSDPTQTVGT